MNYKRAEANSGNITAPNATIADWEFRGWFTDKSATGNKSTDYETATVDDDYFASYQKLITLTKYQASGTTGTATGYMTKDCDNKDTDATITLGAPELGELDANTYTAVGWTSTNSTTTDLACDTTGSVTANTNAIYYARYEGKLSTTKYYASGSSSTSEPITATATYDYQGKNPSGGTATLGTPTDIDGLKFIGWSTSDENPSSSTQLTSGDTTITVSPSTSYYAVYTKTITITYDKNGGTGNDMEPSTGDAYIKYDQTVGTGASIKLEECTYKPPSDKEFGAWILGSGATKRFTAGSTYEFASSCTLLAHWADPLSLKLIALENLRSGR